MTDDLPMRPISEDEWPAFWRNMANTFHEDVHDDELAWERGPFEPERSLAVFDGDQPVATAGIYTRDLTVPGGLLEAAHVTMVSVRATHRRRGLLTRMMRQQLREVRDAGREPVAVLWASEETIYGRFGYGAASAGVSIDADLREVRLPVGGTSRGRLRLVEPADVARELAGVYDQARAQRPGVSSRQGPWWEYRLTDLERHRRGASALRCVLYEESGTVLGYALWRSKSSWNHTGPNSEVQVQELMSTDVTARRELWRFLFEMDLTRRISAWNLPVDEPLFWWVDAPRRLSRQVRDGLFTRIVDLPAALTSRRYAAPVDLVLEVTDDLLPENAGRWRLTGDAEKVTCERTGNAADLTLGIRELGAVYLGGTRLGALAAAGLVHGSIEAVTAADAGFGWHVAPHAPEVF